MQWRLWLLYNQVGDKAVDAMIFTFRYPLFIARLLSYFVHMLFNRKSSCVCVTSIGALRRSMLYNPALIPLRQSDIYASVNIPSLVQIMACRLVPQEHTSMKYQWKFIYLSSRKCVRKYRLRNVGRFVLASMCYNIGSLSFLGVTAALVCQNYIPKSEYRTISSNWINFILYFTTRD